MNKDREDLRDTDPAPALAEAKQVAEIVVQALSPSIPSNKIWEMIMLKLGELTESIEELSSNIETNNEALINLKNEFYHLRDSVTHQVDLNGRKQAETERRVNLLNTRVFTLEGKPKSNGTHNP